MLERMRTGLSNLIMPGTVKQPLTESIGSVVFSPSATGGTPPRLGTRELLLAYSKMPWLRAVVNKTATSVGNTNWQLFVLRPGGQRSAILPQKIQRADFHLRKKLLKQAATRGDLVEIEQHPLLDLLHHGNEVMLGEDILQTTQIHMDLVGESFWILEQDGLGTPSAFWPLPPDWIREFPTKERPTYRIRLSAREIEVPISEIVAFLDLDPANPYSRGTGIAKSLGDELEIDEYAAKHLKNFFFNRARPDLIISGDGISREDTLRMEEKWLDKHKGFWQSFKPSFLSRKVDVKELGQSFEHMQMIDLRKHERDTVIQVYGAPPEKFGILAQSNRSTIEAADFFWAKDIVLPRQERIRNTLQKRVVPKFDERLILDFETPIVQDKEFRLKVMARATWAHSIDEWRKLADEAPLDKNGNLHIVPVNMQPVDIEAGKFPTPPEPEEPEETPEPEEEPKWPGAEVLNSIGERILEIEPQLVEAVQKKLNKS